MAFFFVIPKLEDCQGLRALPKKAQNFPSTRTRIPNMHLLDTLVKMNGWPHAAAYARKCS